MKLGSTVKIALRALRRNKMRSVLTALGIIIGVGAVIASDSIGNGAKGQVEQQIASLGQNVIMIFAGSVNTGGSHSGAGGAALKLDDALAIEREISLVTNMTPDVGSSAQVAVGNQNWYTRINGESESYLDIRAWPLAEGANFSEQDVRSANKVCLLGQTVSQQLFGDESPIGKVIRVRNVPFTVLGLLSKKGMSMGGSDQDDVVVMPYTSAMKRVLGTTYLRSIMVQTAKPTDLIPAQQQIIALMRQRHNIRPGKEDDFIVRTQDELAQMATAASRVMEILLGCFAGVSLVVGGIGIMNIMLVSVTERTREIGIRIAVGAHGRDILMQFLIEACVLSSMGGVIGIVFGFSLSQIIHYFTQWPMQVALVWVAGAFLFSAAVGVFFGFYPARKAAQLDPIDALRYE